MNQEIPEQEVETLQSTLISSVANTIVIRARKVFEEYISQSYDYKSCIFSLLNFENTLLDVKEICKTHNLSKEVVREIEYARNKISILVYDAHKIDCEIREAKKQILEGVKV